MNWRIQLTQLVNQIKLWLREMNERIYQCTQKHIVRNQMANQEWSWIKNQMRYKTIWPPDWQNTWLCLTIKAWSGLIKCLKTKQFTKKMKLLTNGIHQRIRVWLPNPPQIMNEPKYPPDVGTNPRIQVTCLHVSSHAYLNEMNVWRQYANV